MCISNCEDCDGGHQIARRIENSLKEIKKELPVSNEVVDTVKLTDELKRKEKEMEELKKRKEKEIEDLKRQLAMRENKRKRR